jgi:hypothetical protein
MTSWKDTISTRASTVSRNTISRYVHTISDSSSPIDCFYNGRNSILNDMPPELADRNGMLSALSMVGFISLTENYYREVLSRIISICPLAKVKASEKSINLATAWFGYNKIEKAAFENISFSNAEVIKKNLKSLLSITIEPSSQIFQPLESFSELCELRHSIVHSACLLSGQNAVKLKLPSSADEIKVSINYEQLQKTAEICTSLVCATNIELFTHMSKRWLHEWPREEVYRATNMNKSFKQIWELFYSKVDKSLNEIDNDIGMVKTRNLISRSNAA